MHFCKQCDNMYYIRVSGEDENTLIYYCRNCGHEDDMINEGNICVCKTSFKKGEQKYSHIINEFTKLNPTLPRLTNIPCPNPECATHKGHANPDVIYIRYDDSAMKYIYLCSVCDTTWKTDEQK